MSSEACNEGRHIDCGGFVQFEEHDGTSEEDNCHCDCHEPNTSEWQRRVDIEAATEPAWAAGHHELQQDRS